MWWELRRAPPKKAKEEAEKGVEVKQEEETEDGDREERGESEEVKEDDGESGETGINMTLTANGPTIPREKEGEQEEAESRPNEG